ncbi:MAG: rhodanese-like domain-containing protein [Gemmatimonadota bacterium]
MLLERFYHDKLAHASWMVGCAATGEALVVDPNRDVAAYVASAEREKLRITHIAETHIHADFVSGSRELAARTGATLFLSDEGGEDWRYGFARSGRDVLLRDGDTFMVGNIRIEVRHTPGHTPEHIVLVVTDTAAADRPMGVLTGDFVFVGDVGRPDLLERAAGMHGTMEDGARQLFRSLRTFAELPDFLQLWPAHGAGSACGKALGAVPQTTLGYEKLFNWAFQETSEDAFVQRVLAGQPEPPGYFARMKRVNRDGPAVLGGLPRVPRLADRRLEDLLEDDALVVDTRPVAEFAAGHAPGTIHIPLTRSFPTYAGSVLPYDRPLHLVLADGGGALEEVVRDLALIGLDRFGGWCGPEALTEWASGERKLAELPGMDTEELRGRLERGNVHVLDVRSREEWRAGHIPGADLIPLGELPRRMDELPERPLVVHCQTGIRSSIAASLLRAAGVEDVVAYRGSFQAWQTAGMPVEGETVVA